MEKKFLNTPVKTEEIKQAMTLAAQPEARIPAAGWISERISSSLSNWANGGFFDIPNGWVTDAAGIVKIHTWNGSGSAMDVVLTVNGLTDAESHQDRSALGWGKSTLVGQGATVGFSIAKTNLSWFRFKRMW